MSGQAIVIQGDALRLPLPDGSVDLCITSPPYFALRSYSTAHKGQEIGSEPTPAAYLEALWAATAEMVRVLKPSGSIMVDLGDKYVGYTNGQGKGRNVAGGERGVAMVPDGPVSAPAVYGMPNKSLMLLPERYRIGCVDRLGLIARAVIVWGKPNGLPESVTDRVRRSHEDWVHLTRSPRYYSAVDEIREAHTMRPQRRPNGRPEDLTPRPGQPRQAWSTAQRDEMGVDGHPLGKLPGSVWTVPSEPLRLPDHLGVDHYAAFPSEWPRRLILGWSPPGICLDCGQGRVPVVERRLNAYHTGFDEDSKHGGNAREQHKHNWMGAKDAWGSTEATILGYACSCCPFTDHPGSGVHEVGQWADGAGVGHRHGDNPGGGLMNRSRVGPWREYHLDGWKPPPTRPAVVADVFGGTGTVAMVARALGRIGVSLDLSFPYCRAARWRIHHDAGKAISRTWVERQGTLL